MLALMRGSWHSMLLAVGFLLGSMALVTLVRVLHELWKTWRTRSWPTATAVVTEVTVEENPGLHGDSGLTSWRLQVTYRYAVAAERTGRYVFSVDSRTKAEGLEESLPGTEFPVRYDPRDEGTSVVLIGDRPD